MANLSQLITIRSAKAEAVLEFLQRFADVLDRSPWYRDENKPILCSEIYVEPFMLTEQRRRPNLGDRERDGDRHRLDRDPFNERLSPWEEIDAARYELPVRLDEFEQIRWRQVFRGGRTRLLIKGAPGGGKSFITRHTIVETARSEWTDLDAQRVGLDEVIVPIWVTAAALAEADGRDEAEALVEAMQTCHKKHFDLKPCVREWTISTVRAGRALVVIDALDELQETKHRDQLTTWASRLDKQPGIRLIATCRTMHVEERRPWLDWSNAKEVELVPLQRYQQRAMVRKFFSEHSAQAVRLERLLNVNYSMRHACCTPLLMTFACLLHTEGEVGPDTNYAQLYAKVRAKLFSGTWRGIDPSWKGQLPKLEALLRLLEETAWELFSGAPESNSFTSRQWVRCINLAVKRLRKYDELDESPIGANDFLEELTRIGVLAFGGEGKNKIDNTWSFVHRTLLEWNAARALSRRSQEEWLAEAKKHFWFEPEWLEVLTFLAGLLDDAMPLIEAVGREQKNDDLFGSMLALRTWLTGAATTARKSSIEDTCDQVMSFLENTRGDWQDCLRVHAVSMFPRLAANALARSRLECGLLDLTHDDDSVVRGSATDALGATGSERAVDRLLELTQDDDSGVIQSATWALGAIGSEQAVDSLLMFAFDEHILVRWSAAEAFGAIGSEEVVSRLLEFTRNNDAIVRAFAAHALGATGSEGAVSRLLELTYDDESFVCTFAARALGAIGTERAVDRLLELSRELYLDAYDPQLRASAVEALVKIGSERAMEHMLELTHDDDLVVRMSADEAFEVIRLEKGVERLSEQAREGSIGSEWAEGRLLELLHDGNEIIRRSAVKALKATVSERVVGGLQKRIRHQSEHVRRGAAEALFHVSVILKKKIPASD
jgi:HEAT repeat protein